MTWLNEILAFFKNDYLLIWWLLLGGYLVCYGIAWVLATAGRRGDIVHRCRQAWAWAFLVHLLAVVGLTVLWYQKFGLFKSFYVFLMFYIVLALIDLVLLAKLFAASRA